MDGPSAPQDQASIELASDAEVTCRVCCPPVLTTGSRYPDHLRKRHPERYAALTAAGRLPSSPSLTAPDPDDPETWAFPGPPDFTGTWPDLPPAFGPVPERIEVTYCTEFCDDACTCSLAAGKRSDEEAGDAG